MKVIIIILLFISSLNLFSQQDSLYVPESVKDVIKLYEGWRSKAYKDSGGENYAVGYGFSTKDKNKVITKEQGNKIFDKKIANIEKQVKAKIKVQLTQGQFSVLVDMVYNIGGKVLRSTMVKLLNEGKYDLAGLEIKKWVKANGKTLRGLVRRRNWNYELWNQNNLAKNDTIQIQEKKDVTKIQSVVIKTISKNSSEIQRTKTRNYLIYQTNYRMLFRCSDLSLVFGIKQSEYRFIHARSVLYFNRYSDCRVRKMGTYKIRT